MGHLPGLDTQRKRPPRERVFQPLPPAVAQYAPLMLECPRCNTPRLATPERVILWHEVFKGDRSGERYECVGTGELGNDLPKRRAA